MADSIIGAFIGVGGTAFGAILTHYYSLGLTKKNEFIKACVEFKTAFSGIIYWLEQDALTVPTHILGKLSEPEIHKRHEDAISRFRINLRKSLQLKFDEVCKKLYNEKNKHKYAGYFLTDVSSQKEESIKLALKNITELLKFAKY